MSDTAGPLDYEALLDSVDGIVWEVDPETMQFRYVSRQAERLLGYPVKRWLEEEGFWESRIHSADRRRVVDFCRAETRAGRAHQFEYRMMAADGRVVWLRDLCSVRVDSGGVTSLHGVMVDVTEQKRAEETLRVTSERLHTLARDAPIVLFALDRAGVVTFCEGHALGVAGFETAEIVGHSADTLFLDVPGGEQIRANLHRALAGEEFTDLERLAGRTYETRYRTLHDTAGEADGVIGVVVDVTDRVRAEGDRRNLEVGLQHTQRLESLGLLAGGLAHHFNNLLMTVLGSADLVAGELAPDSSTAARIERIQRAARSGAELTYQLLSYAGGGEFEPRRLDLSAVVRDAEDLLRVGISKNARLDLELSEDLPAVVADGSQLTQVLLSLTTNASEALGEDAGVITLRTGILDAARDDLGQTLFGVEPSSGAFVYVEAIDTGVGMDEATRLRAFDPFFTTKFAGRGLGLATALGIVRRHDGLVSVESQAGGGTRIRILLPCAEDSVSDSEEPRAGSAPSTEGVVLVVDDDPDVREIAAEMLVRLGFQVEVASRGSEALEWARTHRGPIAGVLLDITMPELSGAEIARELHQIRPDTPIVLMSGFQEGHARSRLQADLDVGFLKKPFGGEDLSRALRDRSPPGDAP